jgi:hypothetical protein
MCQVGRALTAADDGVLVGHRMLICDRDRKWTASVRQLLATSGIRIVQTSFQAPNANPHAERFVRSIKDECLCGVIPLGERHLRRTIAEFIEHYHRERNHQGLDNELIDPVFPGAGHRLRSSPRATRRAPQLLLSRGEIGAIVDATARPIDGTLRARRASLRFLSSSASRRQFEPCRVQ